MSDRSSDRTGSPHDESATSEPRYPKDHVLGVLDTEAQLTAAIDALRRAGFSDAELNVATGQAAADRLDASTGRSGLAGLAIRLAEKLGAADGEMRVKEHYEQAMREDRYVLGVSAPTDERKQRAGAILREHGAHSIMSFGRFTMTELAPPKSA